VTCFGSSGNILNRGKKARQPSFKVKVPTDGTVDDITLEDHAPVPGAAFASRAWRVAAGVGEMLRLLGCALAGGRGGQNRSSRPPQIGCRTRQAVQSGSGVRSVSFMRHAPKNDIAAATMIILDMPEQARPRYALPATSPRAGSVRPLLQRRHCGPALPPYNESGTAWIRSSSSTVSR
jgi:hypothetical protein